MIGRAARGEPALTEAEIAARGVHRVDRVSITTTDRASWWISIIDLNQHTCTGICAISEYIRPRRHGLHGE
jgi:hypothetical protein